MSKSLIWVGSMTYAKKGESILHDAGLKAFSYRSNSVNKRGCGYVISVDSTEYETARAVLSERGIKIYD